MFFCFFPPNSISYSFLSKYEYYSYNEVIATSKIGNIDLSKMVGWVGQKYDCKISPSRLKVVFDSTRK